MGKKLTVVFVLLFIVMSVTIVDAAILYVKVDALGANNGSSWTDAYRNLQAALSAASSGDEIWVAAGTYKPTETGDRTVSFQLKSGVALYGGFTGKETALLERDFANNESIMSGDIGATGDASDNSYHVVRVSWTDSAAILDGFIVTKGNANGLYPYYFGGGMYNNNSSPTVTNVVFNSNHADYRGGGMYNHNSSPTVTNVNFDFNSAHSAGGGMFNNYSSPTLTNVIFSSNARYFGGGGMFNYFSSPTVTYATFSSNSADAGGGGGMYNHNSSPTVTNATFRSNSADHSGGGMYNYYSSLTVTNATFSSNSGYCGGGMFNNNSSLTVTNATFSSNSADYYGGAMYNHSSNATVTNNILWGNTALNGYQVYNDSSTPSFSDTIVQGDCPAGSSCTNIITTDPLLGSLGSYGGPTQTLPLLPGSSALNAGAETSCPLTDQRGMTRIWGCDIGAYEFIPTTSTGLTAAPNPSSYGQSVTFTATITDSEAASNLSGTVTFYDGATEVAGCTGIMVESRNAECSTATLSRGTHSITATYSGDVNFAGSTSNPVAQIVNHAYPAVVVPAMTDWGIIIFVLLSAIGGVY